jgi:hypothetical protein
MRNFCERKFKKSRLGKPLANNSDLILNEGKKGRKKY